MAVGDMWPMKSRQRRAVQLGGRWVGAGAAVPTKVAKTGGRGMTLTRSGVGTLALTLDDKWPNIGAVSITAHSPDGKTLWVTPYNATTRTWAIQVKNAAAADADLAATDQLIVNGVGLYTSVP